MVFRFSCTTVGKYCKLPLDMQRPIVSNELHKGRCATCKGRMSVMLCGYMHTKLQCSQITAYQYIATYIVILNSLTEVM